MNIARIALDNIDRYGGYVSTYFEERKYTNLEMYRYSCRMSSVLLERGIARGDSVVVMMLNCPEVVSAFSAIWKIGAVIIPVTPMWTERELRYVLEDSKAKVVITSPELASRVKQASAGLDGFREVLVIGETETEGVVDIEPIINSADIFEPVLEMRDDDLAMLLYTSGTTGNPKGVMLSHDNMHFISESIYRNNESLGQMRGIQVLPLSHVYGVLIMNLGMWMGWSFTILKHFDAERVFQTIEKMKVQRLAMVPTMLTLLVNQLGREKYDLSSLEYVSSGGAALSEATRQEFMKLFGCKVVQGYGLSESSGALSGYQPEEEYRVGSVGRPLPGVEMCVQDFDYRILPPNETGELCSRGRHIMKGYLNRPEATREAIIDGWLHTGDIGYMDPEGYVYITDRRKDLIIKGAENISPREIEELIYTHPSVAEATVFGVPDETYGEEIIAAVVVRSGHTLDEETLKRHLAAGLMKFKIPSRIVFPESLPKNPTGKILKRAIREQYLASLQGD